MDVNEWMVYMFEKITQEQYQKDLIMHIESSKKELKNYMDKISDLLIKDHSEKYATISILLSEESTISILMYAIRENINLLEDDKLSNGDNIYFMNENGISSKTDPTSYDLLIDVYNNAIKINGDSFDVDELNDAEEGINLPKYTPSKLSPDDQVAYT
ncbi:MAG: hypothetical protein K0B07_03775 [DPANN group archaeon]|nr:hypothetical protein [DPANN group archaeon]